MQKKLLIQARRKFMRLKKKYAGFINVIVDDWRGPRFIFDTKDVRKCKNNCSNCPLYLLLKNEEEDEFSPNLYKADKNDKKLFGPQNFLNCKTLEQYKNCYVNFLLKKTKSKRKIEDELKLISNLKIIYASGNNPLIIESNFKKAIVKTAFRLASQRKKKIISQYINPAISPAPF